MNQNVLEALAASWKKESSGQVQRAIWNRAAADYRAKPLPGLAESDFLRRMGERIPLHSEVRTLDVGCGSGVYSLALAKAGVQAVGVDISDGMIDGARARAEEMGLGGTSFSCMDWSEADVDSLGFRGQFDVVFAHMTPAVHDFATLDKLNACSRNLCMVEKPTRRTDFVLNETFAAIGLPISDYDSDMPKLFTYLWAKGYEPEFFYRKEEWNPERSTEDMVAWCTNRARLQRELTPEEEAVISSVVNAHSDCGKVRERTVTTCVTVIWRVEK